MGHDSQYRYLVAGLTIGSEMALPELIPCSSKDFAPDVEIHFAPVSTNLPGATQSTFETQTTATDVLIKIPDVARYLIKAGRTILIDAEAGVEVKDVRLFLLGSAFGAIYFQRGYLPLHASVVVINGQAVAFMGESGAGKSTLAAWLNSQGYPLLCDDVCVIRFEADGVPVAYPAFPRLKLWNDALEAFDIDASALQKDYFRADKYHLHVTNKFSMDPVPLKHMFILQFSDVASKPGIEDIQPAHAVPYLRNNTYRNEYISGLGLTRSHFLDCVKLAQNTSTHILSRPRRFSEMAECQKVIEQSIQ